MTGASSLSGGKPKVVIVGPTPPPVHGVSQIIGWLVDSEELSRSVQILHLDTSDRRSSENLGRVDFLNIVLGLKALFSIVKLCAVDRPSLVYYTLSQNTPALVRDTLLASVARLFSVATVPQLAGSGYEDIVARGGLSGSLVRRNLKRASLVLVLGQAQTGPIQAIAGHDRIGVAPNGLPLVAQEAEKRSDQGVCVFLYLGSLKAAKGVVAALEAIAEVSASGRRVEAVFCGKWANDRERDSILEIVETLGLSGIVDFAGVVEGKSKEAMLRRADVYLLPSYGEGQPVSILEAMAHGLPVISTRVGAIPDTVIDGETGLLVEPGDKVGLSDAIGLLVDKPELRLRLGSAGVQRFAENYTLQKSHEILAGHLLRVAAGDYE